MNYTKTINRRRVTSGLLVVAMLFSMMAGTLAFFTDRAETQATATAGSVKIALDDSGINLKDADGKDIMNPGDGRDFDFSVKNVGNKSIDVQETIILSAFDKDGNALSLADTQSEFEIYNTSDVTYDETKGWVPNDGAQPLTVKVLDNNTITYTRPAYTLSGNSELGNDNREIETIDGTEASDINNNDFKLIFKTTSSNKFQAAVLKADVLIEAKQHRNTEAVEFAELQKVTHVLSNGNQVILVPGANDGIVINPSEDFTVESLGNDQIKITGMSSTGAAKDTITVPSTIYDAENDKTYTVTDVDWENVFNTFNGSTIDNSNAPVQPEDELVYTMSSDGSKTTITGLTTDGKKLTDIEVPTQVNGEDVTINNDFAEDIENSNANVEIPDEIIENLAAEAIYTYTTDDGSGNTTITGLTSLGKAANTLDIPETLDGMTVTGIQKYALFTTTAETVIIPSTITSAPYAFARENVASGQNKSVMNVTVNNSIVDINMFMGCVALDSVTFTAPNTVINGGAFYGCTDLANVNGMENVISIGAQAFYGCTKLEGIDLANVESIGTEAFSNSGLTAITVPASVTSVGDGAFKNCDSLTSITLENNTISNTMFADCDALEEVTIPANITKVTNTNHSNAAFKDCDSLKTVNIENSVIGQSMFANCDAIESVTVPASVTTYMTNYTGQNQAFYDCDGITEIIFEDGAQVGTGMFESCDGLTEVTIPSTVTIVDNASYGAKTFRKCTNLTTVSIDTNIGGYMFEGCTGLNSVTLGDNVASIGKNAFSGCTALKAIDLNKVTNIGQGAFYNSGLEGDIVIPDTVTTIGTYAFQNCTGITSITFPAGTTTIPANVVNGCTGLTDIYLPDTVTSINKSAFNKVDGVTIHYAGTYTSDSPWGATNATVVAD